MYYKKHLAEKMKDPDFKREYEALEPEFYNNRDTSLLFTAPDFHLTSIETK